MTWELFDVNEAKQLKHQIISYAEDKREFSQTKEELMMQPESIGRSMFCLMFQFTNLLTKFFQFALIQLL